MSDQEIFEADFGDGDVAFAMVLPINPYGETMVAAADTASASKILLQELLTCWPVLWSKILARLEEDISDYGAEVTLGDDEFLASVSYLEKEFYMADKADIFLRLQFDEPPLWDAFIKGDELVHFQAVY
jgi:hypothetical protein